ncbi:hypothetical protein KP626_03815 [Christensenella sp. MSJ-20]|uniref:hypothetical protein n=1 Tax=Christensenella sp. MSJ-20 TaxID=2841518 RepID=UPI001C7403B3|nr:hypothetical protein KP626_03815 [Christensenella sp. MSJ-20]
MSYRISLAQYLSAVFPAQKPAVDFLDIGAPGIIHDFFIARYFSSVHGSVVLARRSPYELSRKWYTAMDLCYTKFHQHFINDG